MAETLADFPIDRFIMIAECNECGHRGEVEYADLPPEMTTDELSRRLRCKECGSRHFRVQRIYAGVGSLMPSARDGESG